MMSITFFIFRNPRFTTHFACFERGKAGFKMKRIITIALFVIAVSGVSFAQTNVWGDVSGVWDISGSPYRVIDTIYVRTGDSLIVEHGVEVTFLGHYKLFVDSLAVLKARGTLNDSIKFMPSDTSFWSPGWHGIRFYYASDACSLSYCEMAYGFAYGLCEDDSCGGAIWSYCSNPTFEHCLIRDCWANIIGGAIYQYVSYSMYSNCKIVRNGADSHGGGLYAQSCVGLIANSIINENNPEGIYMEGRDMGISSCQICNNNGDGIFMSGGGDPYNEWTGNYIASNNGEGIHAHGTGLITNNQIINNLEAGIFTYHSADILGNEIQNNGGSGIFIESLSSEDTVANKCNKQ